MDIKLIGRDTALYGFGNALLRFSSFLLIPLYTHTLSITEYGLLTTLLTSIQIMIIFMGLGSQTSFLRFYPEFQSGQNICQLLTASMIINMTGGLFVMLVCYTLLAPLFVAVSHVPDSSYIILTSLVAIFQSLSLHIISLYRARNQPLRFIISSLSGSTFLIILNLLFLIVLKAGIKGALLAQVITYAGLWTVLLFSIFRKTAIRISGSLLCKLLRFGFPLIFSLVGELLTFESPVFVLSYFKGLKEVAIYSVALKIAQISVLALFLPFQMAYEPYVYNNSGKPGLSATITDLLTYIMLIFAILAFGIVLFARDLIPVISTPEYFPAYYLLFFLLPALAFKGLYYLEEPLLHITNRTLAKGVTVFAFSLCALACHFLLIPRFGIYGAAITLNITITPMALFLLVLTLRSFYFRLDLRRLALIFILLIYFFSSCLYFQKSGDYIYYSVMLVVATSSFLFLHIVGFFSDKERIQMAGLIRGNILPHIPRLHHPKRGYEEDDL